MGQYVPLYREADQFTVKADAPLVGGQLVAVTSPRAVSPTTAGSTAWCGVVGFDAKAGDDVLLYTTGVQRIKASGAIAAGSPVIAGANGTVVANANPPAGQQVGTAISSAADQALVEVLMAR